MPLSESQQIALKDLHSALLDNDIQKAKELRDQLPKNLIKEMLTESKDQAPEIKSLSLTESKDQTPQMASLEHPVLLAAKSLKITPETLMWTLRAYEDDLSELFKSPDNPLLLAAQSGARIKVMALLEENSTCRLCGDLLSADERPFVKAAEQSNHNSTARFIEMVAVLERLVQKKLQEHDDLSILYVNPVYSWPNTELDHKLKSTNRNDAAKIAKTNHPSESKDIDHFFHKAVILSQIQGLLTHLVKNTVPEDLDTRLPQLLVTNKSLVFDILARMASVPPQDIHRVKFILNEFYEKEKKINFNSYSTFFAKAPSPDSKTSLPGQASMSEAKSTLTVQESLAWAYWNQAFKFAHNFNTNNDHGYHQDTYLETQKRIRTRALDWFTRSLQGLSPEERNAKIDDAMKQPIFKDNRTRGRVGETATLSDLRKLKQPLPTAASSKGLESKLKM